MRRTVVASLVPVVLLITACSVGAGPSAPASPTAAVSPSANPPTSQGPCDVIEVIADGPPNTIPSLVGDSDRVVVGVVRGVESGIFNTPDQKRPMNPVRGPNNNPMIYTPYNLQVTETLLGPPDPGVVRAVTNGGEADCLIYEFSPAVVVERNKTYVFFLQPSPDAAGDPHPELPLIMAAWPVDTDGNVQTELDGVLSLQQLSTAVAAAPR